MAERLGHDFAQPELLRDALTHRSFRNERPNEAPADNERLEFLGDAVLGAGVAYLLHQAFPEAREGELTRRRAELVSEGGLLTAAEDLALGAALDVHRMHADVVTDVRTVPRRVTVHAARVPQDAGDVLERGGRGPRRGRWTGLGASGEGDRAAQRDQDERGEGGRTKDELHGAAPGEERHARRPCGATCDGCVGKELRRSAPVLSNTRRTGQCLPRVAARAATPP